MARQSTSAWCAFCGQPSVPGAWVEIRLYLGPGLKIGELELRVCRGHLEAMWPAYQRELVECRVSRWEPGTHGRGS